MNLLEIENLLDATQNSDPKVRKESLLKLCACRIRANKPQIWDRIFQMQSDNDAGVRSVVLHNLCDGSPHERKDEAVHAVEKLAKDTNLKLRRRARNALAVYRRTGSINIE